jgi:hypothetical protein
MNITSPPTDGPVPRAALYLRDDGSMLLVRGQGCIEIKLTPAQLLQMGVDCLMVATQQRPEMHEAATAVLAGCQVPPHLVDDAKLAMSQSAVIQTGGKPCLLN